MARRSARTAGLLPLPSSRAALELELGRVDRERRHARAPRGRRLLAIEHQRLVLALDRLEDELERLVSIVAPRRDLDASRRSHPARADSLSSELEELAKLAGRG